MASRAIILQGNPRPLTAYTSVFTMKSDVHEVYRTADTYWLCLDSDNGSALEKGNEVLACNLVYLAGCLFTFGCYIVDKDKLYNAPDLKRYVRANKTETYMSKSERDTFRYIGKSYQELTPEQRRAIASCKDPEFPLGVPQWVAYITGTVLEKVSNQDRLKGILTHSAFSSLADTYCRFLWGRGTFANTMWCELIRESSRTRRSRPLRTRIVDSYGIEARSRIEKCLETCIGSSPPREDIQIATHSIKQKSIRLSRDDCLGSCR
ncbi:hypothetical protein LTR72_009771 [Exophiala xenobiotica]|nr:hypothetical protein LTR92_010375 [Exophiala xenobiotica]KAK5206188.1 hypothetical protein LTR41_008057 [Exophiala xenobiotica]KAK5217205.1 hypothetical protein LTR72_009771 [Exophiala xenobiotica]KAK5247420.1 hypothetical protein LTS06_007406 [Exophiala xenobiotica]KAK5259444.1 hypothetical protein LTR40_005992 [Exophiala xenobiotica]